MFVCIIDFDFISLSETWLSPNINIVELGLDNYTYRYDRNSLTSNCLRCGGVLTAINNRFYSRMLHILVSQIEQVFVIVKTNFDYIIIGNVYFPPRSTITLYKKYFDTINDLLISFPNIKNFI